MIYAPLSGNFGNNLIAYLITRLVAEKNNYEFGINPHPDYDYYNHKSQLYFFNLDYGKQHDYTYHETANGIINIWQEKCISTLYGNDKIDFYYYQPDVYNILDNTKIFTPCMQDARYYDPYREKISNWLQIKEENRNLYSKILRENNIELDDDTCIINCRGGEYLPVKNLLLTSDYWTSAINIMKDINPKMKFICVSDDPNYAKKLFNCPIVHLDIGGDYFIIHSAKYLIISNSSFAIFSSYTNQRVEKIIAPKYWSRHNIEIWANSNMWTFNFEFLDKQGKLFTSKECEKEQEINNVYI